MKINKCRSCESTSLVKCLDLGNQYLTGIFPSSSQDKIPKGELNMIICKKCKLLQLGNSFDADVMYGDSYGYMSSLNPHMIKHLKLKSEKFLKIVSASTKSCAYLLRPIGLPLLIAF